MYDIPLTRRGEKGVHSAEIGWQLLAFPICPALTRIRRRSMHQDCLTGGGHLIRN